MREGLDRLDDRLRGALSQPAAPAALIALGLFTALGFLALLATRTLLLLGGAGMFARAATLLCLCAPLALALVFAMRAARESELGLLPAAAVCAACAAAMLLRLSFIERTSSDYEIYLANWLDQFGGMSFSAAMRGGVGEYNVLYQYILFILSRLPVPQLYAVKAVSFLGDALLAGAAARLCAKEGKASWAALCAMLLLPSAALNGALFVQCDSLFAACGLWGLALAMEGKPAGSAACFALSLAFKLQAMFLLPVVAVLWAGKRLRLCDALIFLGTLALVSLPALLGGKSPAQLIGIYAAQTGLYTGLTYNAPGLFGLMNTVGLDVYAYGNFGIALALGACALIVGCGVTRAQDMGARETVHLALVMTLAVVFFLPRMHERYFYLPTALALAAAVGDRRFMPCAALLELAALGTLIDMGLALNACALCALAALVWAAREARRA